MKEIYNEKEVENLADSFAKKTTDKLKEQLLDAFYDEVKDYLYEHYSNFKDRAESELIKSICEEYVKNPLDYKYAKLREKMFLENKDELTKTLTNEAIYLSVERIIQQYTFGNYHFAWQWKDGIARFILENLEKIKDDQRVNEWIERRIKDKDNRIQWLEDKLREASNVLDD